MFKATALVCLLQYGQFLKLMTRFVEHPLAHKEAKYIMKFRQRLNRQNFGDKIKPVSLIMVLMKHMLTPGTLYLKQYGL